MKKQSLILIAGVLGALTLSACGGGNSCGSVCNTSAKCTTTITGQPVDPIVITSCEEQCSATTCTGSKQAALDCSAAVVCGTDLTAYATAIAACGTAQGCGAAE